MFVEPTARAEARPLLPEAVLIAAIVGLDELQTDHTVRSCDVLSTRVPVALNCCVNPWGTFTACGATAMDVT